MTRDEFELHWKLAQYIVNRLDEVQICGWTCIETWHAVTLPAGQELGKDLNAVGRVGAKDDRAQEQIDADC